MPKIKLPTGQTALVDEQDATLARSYGWRLNHYGYVVAYRDSKCLYLHRLIMQAIPGQEVDHIHFNKLDNRRSELRLATRLQNSRNQRGKPIRTSRFKGVFRFKRDNNWAAQIKIDKKSRHLGYFDSEQDAAVAYDTAARLHFGEFAHTNF